MSCGTIKEIYWSPKLGATCIDFDNDATVVLKTLTEEQHAIFVKTFTKVAMENIDIELEGLVLDIDKEYAEKYTDNVRKWITDLLKPEYYICGRQHEKIA